MKAEIIAFASGKGGTGKSTTAVYVGAALASQGRKVLLVELDSALRSVDIIAGVSGQTVYDIEDVLSGRVRPGKAVVSSALYRGLSVISAPYSGEVITTRSLHLLCEKLSPFFDTILIDTAAGIGKPFKAATQEADLVVLVLTADPVALRDGRILADELATEGKAMRLVLNRVNPDHILRDHLLRDLDEAIDVVGVQLLGVVPESASILTASTGGSPLPHRSREMAVYSAIAGRLRGLEVPLVFGTNV